MQLTQAEIESGALTDANLALAVRTLHDAGLVILEGVYQREWIAELRVAYDEALERHIASRGGIEGLKAKTFGENHIGMHLPLVMPFSDPQIVANPIAVQVMARALGDDLQCSFYHSNTSYPGSGYQPIHRDNLPLFGSEMGVAHPPVTIVLNVPLCDFNEENGSTEVWPGSHLIVDTAATDAKELAARVEMLASIRTNMPAGSIVLRDLRTWHRGMPNRASYARAMLAIVYRRSWRSANQLLDIPQSTWDAWPEQTQQIFRSNKIV